LSLEGLGEGIERFLAFLMIRVIICYVPTTLDALSTALSIFIEIRFKESKRHRALHSFRAYKFAFVPLHIPPSPAACGGH
jgi:hypothetical protein